MTLYARNETASAYNVAGTAQYTCGTTGRNGCERHNRTPPANFPGGGGSFGHVSSDYNVGIAGGIGAPGYVRILY
jgi:hypothetical protein